MCECNTRLISFSLAALPSLRFGRQGLREEMRSKQLKVLSW
jgi:hypothetical protein